MFKHRPDRRCYYACSWRDDRTNAGLFRGFILRNSDVGAAALTLEVFLFRTGVRESSDRAF
jgi:hypothetical protein